MRAEGSDLQVAAIATGEDGGHLILWESHDEGLTWVHSEVSCPIPPFVHLSPQWDGSELVWAGQEVEGQAAFCRRSKEGMVRCVSTDVPRIDSFVVREGQIVAAVDRGVGQWDVETW